MNERKRQEVNMGLLGGLAGGIVLFTALYAITSNLYTALFIPVAVIMGGAQAYLSPRNK